MASTTFTFPLTSGFITDDVTAYGYVSGDVTTITAIKLENGTPYGSVTPTSMKSKRTTINGVTYSWTVDETAHNALDDVDYVKKAHLNIGSRLVINLPFFEIKYGGGDLAKGIYSFYDLGELPGAFWDWGVSPIDITGNESITISLQEGDDSIKLSSDATYRFSWILGSKSYVATRRLSSGATEVSAAYKVPKAWNTEIPSAEYAYITLRIESIFGTKVYETKQTTVLVNVPDDCVPVINSITLADMAGRVPASWGMFVQENSNVGLSEVNTTISYGSAIKKVEMEVDDRKYTGTPSSLPVSRNFTNYGVMTITVTVTDGRGRTAEKTARITVVKYSPPAMSVDSMRCGSDGSIENEGMYFLAMTSTEYSTCNGKNPLTLTVAYKLASESTYRTPQQIATGQDMAAVVGGDLDTEFSYDVQYILRDQFNTLTVIDYVSTAVYLMHFLHGGRGVAFGQKATIDNCADFAFDALFRGKVEFEKPSGETVTIQQIIEKLGL